MLNVHTFPSSIELTANSANLHPDISSKVDALWKSALLKNPTLTDGIILSISKIETNTIFCNKIPYRYWIAQKQCPELFSYLKTQPLAVSGLLCCEDGIIFGKRSSQVTQQPDCWELVPSGGVEEECIKNNKYIDYQEQLYAELKEELGIFEESIINTKSICLIEDSETHVFDIGITLTTLLKFKQVKNCFLENKNSEYTDITLVNKQQLPKFLHDNNDYIVKESKELLNHYLR